MKRSANLAERDGFNKRDFVTLDEYHSSLEHFLGRPRIARSADPGTSKEMFEG